MSKKLFLVCLLALTFSFSARSQYVTIPDTNFAQWLQLNYPSCMIGNQMDTTCSQILFAPNVDVSNNNIHDLTGIQYFRYINTLDCGDNQITSLPPLPTTLKSLWCDNNQLTSLPPLPNQIFLLECSNNVLTILSTLPDSLHWLICSNNSLTNLPSLPNKLENLYCESNILTSLPLLPITLLTLDCSNNALTGLPPLPNTLQEIHCQSNYLTSLPPLPNSLGLLDCSMNLLTSLPFFPSSLNTIKCSNNQLSSLPILQNSFFYSLDCSYNQLTTMPALPVSVSTLWCQNNHIYNLVNLPQSLQDFKCQNNNISCFPVFPNSINTLNISNNPFTCLPNYISHMSSGQLAYPICITGDSINNPNGCNNLTGTSNLNKVIIGFTYKDNNSNCILDSGDIDLKNIPVRLYDSLGNYIAYTNSAFNGLYYFITNTGTHTVKIDTLSLPFKAQCINPGIDSMVVISTLNPTISDVNFNLMCKQGYDVGVVSVHHGPARPGIQHLLEIFAGDLSNWYNLHCAAGISGQVQVTVNGPVTFDGIPSGALIPAASGNVFTYFISNFDSIPLHSIRLLFTVDTNAQVGDSICLSVVTNPYIGDENQYNNYFHYCYPVRNSSDPNMKEVYPVNVPVGFNDYFTYTLHFQNTGNAPAINIRLVDTLSNNLDLETFELINYSHNNVTSLDGRLLTIRFPNIQLPDSATDQEGSKGFVQYRIKPKASWAIGTQIKNTAWIYFDYNPRIKTNTTINQYDLTIGINENKEEIISLKIYPNPFTADATIQFDNKVSDATLIIYDMLGQKLKAINHISGDKVVINRGNISNGIYFIRLIQDNKIIAAGKIIITG
jgi:uncharacterized repeat protein (TIGR01451 family)